MLIGGVISQERPSRSAEAFSRKYLRAYSIAESRGGASLKAHLGSRSEFSSPLGTGGVSLALAQTLFDVLMMAGDISVAAAGLVGAEDWGELNGPSPRVGL